MVEIRYASIRELDISNGENIGVSLFVQGCHFHCKGCFNQDTWNFSGGKEWTEEIENQFLELIDKPYIKRISFLGGEPLAKENLVTLLGLIKKINYLFPDKKIWLFTGYTVEQIIDEFNIYKYTPFAIDADEWLTRHEIIGNIDILVDGRFEENKKDLTLKFRGSKNQRVINVQESLKQDRVVLYCD